MPSRGLLVIVLLNLAIATAGDAVAWIREGQNPAKGLLCVFCIFNGVFYAQATVLGAMAALIPRRGLLGLIIVATYAVFFGYALWFSHTSLSLLSRGVPFLGIFFALIAIAVQIVLWGSRLVFGWRITTEPSPQQSPRQFHLTDLLELTVLCGVWLGLNLVLENDGVRSRLMVMVFSRFIVSFVLLGIPVLFVVLNSQPPQKRTILALALWYVLVDLGLALIPIHEQDNLASSVRHLPYHAFVSGAFLLTVVANGLLLRRIGYYC